MASFVKIAIQFMLICYVAGDSNDDIIKQLKAEVLDLENKEFQNSVLIQGLTSEMTQKDIIIQNLQRQLNQLDQDQANVTSDLQLQKTSLLAVTEKQNQNANNISSLTNRETFSESEMNNLKSDFLTSRNVLNVLTLRLDNVTEEAKTQGSEISSIQNSNQKQLVEFEQFKSRMVSLFAKEEQQIAFMARFLDDKGHHDIGGMTILQFDDIVLNSGYTFNTTAGVFTAPVKGIYLFQLTVSSVGAKVQLNLIGGSNTVYGTVIADTAHIQSSTNAVLHLDVGSKVWTQRVVGVRVGAIGLTQFSGVLVQAD